MNKVIMFGENHQEDYFLRERRLIELLKREKRIDYLLLETIYDNVVYTKDEAMKLIERREYLLGGVHLKMAMEYELPAIGIDLPKKTMSGFYRDVKDFPDEFRMRESQMTSIVKEYRERGNCLLIVGDTHLRVSRSKEIGEASLLWTTFRYDPNVVFVRMDDGTREIDNGFKDRSIVSFMDIYRDIKSGKW